jgi:hypothetical protein
MCELRLFNQSLRTHGKPWATAKTRISRVWYLSLVLLICAHIVGFGCNSVPSCSTIGIPPQELIKDHPLIALCVIEDCKSISNLGPVVEWDETDAYQFSITHVRVIERFQGVEVSEPISICNVSAYVDDEGHQLSTLGRPRDTVLVYGRPLSWDQPLYIYASAIGIRDTIDPSFIVNGRFTGQRGATYYRDSCLLDRALRSEILADSLQRESLDTSRIVLGYPKDKLLTSFLLGSGAVCLESADSPSDITLETQEYLNILRNLTRHQ